MKDNIVSFSNRKETFTLASILGLVIFSERMKCHLSIEELAEKSLVGIQTITLIEGGGNCTVFEVEQLCQTLGISLHHIADAIMRLKDV